MCLFVKGNATKAAAYTAPRGVTIIVPLSIAHSVPSQVSVLEVKIIVLGASTEATAPTSAFALTPTVTTAVTPATGLCDFKTATTLFRIAGEYTDASPKKLWTHGIGKLLGPVTQEVFVQEDEGV